MPEPISNELQPSQLKAQVKVDFQHFVGGLVGDINLQTMPDAMSKGHVDLLKKRIDETTKRPFNSPGRLERDKDTGKLHAVDPDSPIGKVEQLQEYARSVATTDPNSVKNLEAHIRKQLVEITNEYATSWSDSRFEVARGANFRGVSLDYFVSRPLLSFRKDLLEARHQAIDKILFSRWDDRPNNLKDLRTPSFADLYLFTNLALDASGAEATRLYELINSPDGYLGVADQFYAGDLTKTYGNVSLVFKMNRKPMPESWCIFFGTTAEFRSLSQLLQNSNYNGVEGHLQLSDELFGGAMMKTFNNVSAVTKIKGVAMPKGWQEFRGTTTEFKSLSELLKQPSDSRGGVEGYLKLSDELYGGDMHKTYMNISAISNSSSQSVPEGWRLFTGTTAEFRSLSQLLQNSNYNGVEGYIRLSSELYDGDMLKTYMHVSAVSNMSKLPMPEGWLQFKGTTAEFRSQFDWMRTHSPSNVDDFKQVFYPHKKDVNQVARLNFSVLKSFLKASQEDPQVEVKT